MKAPSAKGASLVSVASAVDPVLYAQALEDVRGLRLYGTYQPSVDERLEPTADPRCGTRTGYRAHAKRGEHACRRCLSANAGRPADDEADSTPAPDHTWRTT